MLLYFAGQGSGRVAAPFLAGTIRLIFVAGGAQLGFRVSGPEIIVVAEPETDA